MGLGVRLVTDCYNNNQTLQKPGDPSWLVVDFDRVLAVETKRPALSFFASRGREGPAAPVNPEGDQTSMSSSLK